MGRYRLEIIVFLSGAVVMVLELVGSRLVAPYLGTSIYVWTSLIGIILGSLSLGYWWGGLLADRRPDYRTFSLLLLAAAGLIGLIAWIQVPVLEWIQRRVPDIRPATVLAAIALFGPAGTLLGAVSPFAVRLKLQDLDHSGSTVGRLYAISTVGSITGTFLAGFFLIATLGSSRILIVLSATLVGLSPMALRGRPSRRHLAIGLLIAAGLPFLSRRPGGASTDPLLDRDTPYNRVIIEERLDALSGKTIRYLRTGINWGQSAVVVGEPETLFFDYLKFFRLAEHFLPENRDALLIGGGAYTFPRDYLGRKTDARMDVVEIDPHLRRLAEQYFYLGETPRMRNIEADGRTFLNRSRELYDVLFLDVYPASASPPFQMTTREAVARMHALLREEGLVLANLFSPIEGRDGRFFRAAYWTFREAFPQVWVFPVRDPGDGMRPQNIVLAALKSERRFEARSDDPELDRFLSHRWIRPVPKDVPVLEDGFAPVDHYLLGILADY